MRKIETLEFNPMKLQATPLYSQLSNVFRELIRSEKWTVGNALPSEVELARRYGVSVGTARKALESLQEDGWITRRQGRGTFVSDPGEQQCDRFCKIYFNGTGANLFGVCSATVLKQERSTASPEESALLDLPRLASVVRLRRVLHRQKTPVLLEDQVLRADLFPDLEKREDLPTSLYSIFLVDYGIAVGRCLETITSVAASTEVSEVLKVAPGAPVLRTVRRIEDVDGRLIALVDRTLVTTNVEYSVTLT